MSTSRLCAVCLICTDRLKKFINARCPCNIISYCVATARDAAFSCTITIILFMPVLHLRWLKPRRPFLVSSWSDVQLLYYLLRTCELIYIAGQFPCCRLILRCRETFAQFDQARSGVIGISLEGTLNPVECDLKIWLSNRNPNVRGVFCANRVHEI